MVHAAQNDRGNSDLDPSLCTGVVPEDEVAVRLQFRRRSPCRVLLDISVATPLLRVMAVRAPHLVVTEVVVMSDTDRILACYYNAAAYTEVGR